MDFGAILDKWEKQGGASPDAIRMNLPVHAGENAGQEKSAREAAQEKRRRLMHKKPDAVIDLHGKTREEAWLALDSFFQDSKDSGHEKVLVVHGKGNRSPGEAVLKRMVIDFIERCPFAGESGHGKATIGGEGATWVFLKENQDFQDPGFSVPGK
jgi:DNA-nicking Smr family endonuclease